MTRISKDAGAAARSVEDTPKDTSFVVKFRGVRGSIACSGPETTRYGGNTSCIELVLGGRTMLFDAGTGLRYAGVELARHRPVDIDIFLTHTHFDHVCGLPFFPPLFCPDCRVRIWAGHLRKKPGLYEVIKKLMDEPLFPVPPSVFQANWQIEEFVSGDTLEPRPGIVIRTAPLNHPNGATGYRIEFGGRSFCYITDTEHVPGQLDAAIIDLVRGADMMVYDCTYTDAEFADHVGWGHSTWEEGARLSDAAGVGTFVVFHHDPGHDDRFMDAVAEAVEKARPGSVVAHDRLVLTL